MRSLLQADLDGVITRHWNSNTPVLTRPVPQLEPPRLIGRTFREWWQGESWESSRWAYPEYCVNETVAGALRDFAKSCQLSIVTDRPPSLISETRDLVARTRLEAEIFFTERGRSAAHRKLEIAQAIKPVLILEDDRHQANFLGEHGLQVILLDRPNNRGPEHLEVMRVAEANLAAILRIRLWEGEEVGTSPAAT